MTAGLRPSAYDLVTQRLSAVTGFVGNGSGWRCPAHDDRTPSLSVAVGDGRVLVHCQAGCEIGAVLAALNLEPADLFDEPLDRAQLDDTVATYRYVDETSNLLFEVLRKPGKRFIQRRPDGHGGWDWKLGDTRRVLYRLPAVIDAVKNGHTVFVAEGEKDVEALERAGEIATCNPGGAGKWRPEYADTLTGAAEVVIIRDNDPVGVKHAADVEASLTGHVGALLVVEAKTGKDAADHLAAGHTVDEFEVVGVYHDDASSESSWAPVDLASLRDRGVSDQPVGTMLVRTDGIGLVYPGKVHSFNGESESGKSWAACVACLGEIAAGRPVTYLDFEDDAATVTGRMLALGATWDELIAHFEYRRPEEAVTPAEVINITSRQPVLVVIDGVGAAMELHDLDPDKNRDSARFMRLLVHPIARSGAAVVQVDHVTKNPEQRGKYAIGAQHKRAAITGAMYTFAVAKPFGRGMAGTININVEKDKPGHVRRAATGKKAAQLHLTSNPEGTIVTAELHPPGAATDAPFRPTVLMERVSRRLEQAGENGLTKNGIKEACKGNKDHLGQAADVLANEGYVTVHHKGQAHHHVSVKPYRRADDPLEQEDKSDEHGPAT